MIATWGCQTMRQANVQWFTHLATVAGLDSRRVANELEDLGSEAHGLTAVVAEELGVHAG